MYLAIIILPLLSSMVSGLFGRKVGVNGSHIIACLSMLLTTVLTIIAFIEVCVNNTPVYLNLFTWRGSESLNVSWGFSFDTLTVSILIPVLIVSLLVHIYSIGYMSHGTHNQRFFSYLSLFTFMMIILVTSNNFIFMFVGWEGVWVCFYLLVSYWFTTIAANQSPISIFFINRTSIEICLGVGLVASVGLAIILFYSQHFTLGLLLTMFIISVFLICLFMWFSLELLFIYFLVGLMWFELFISKYMVRMCFSDLGSNYLLFFSLYALNVMFMFAIAFHLTGNSPTKFTLIFTLVITFIVVFSHTWYIDFYSILYIAIEYKIPTVYEFTLIHGMNPYENMDRRIANSSTDDLRTRRNVCGNLGDKALRYLIIHFGFNSNFNYNNLSIADRIKFFEKYQVLLLSEIEREKINNKLISDGSMVRDGPRRTKSFMLHLIEQKNKGK